MTELIMDIFLSQGYKSTGGIILSLLIAIWVFGKGRSFLISMGISFLLCPLVAFIVQLFLRENKRKMKEDINKGIGRAIGRIFFGG